MSNKHMTDLQAYEIIKEEALQDLGSKGTLLRHKKSGARIALIENTDENKVFYIVYLIKNIRRLNNGN